MSSNTIYAGQAAQLAVTVQRDGAPLVLSGSVVASVYSMDGKQTYIDSVAADSATPGADWANGVVVVLLDATQTALVPAGTCLLVLAGDFGIHRFRVTSETLFEPTRTSLFIRDLVVDEIRSDRLMAAAAGILQDVKVSDDYIWDKVRAAESEISHELRVPLVPTRYFPQPPTDQQIADAGDMPWTIEIGADYDHTLWEGDKWCMLTARRTPIISIESIQFSYPSQGGVFIDLPKEWLNWDARSGQIRIVPTASAVITQLTGYFLSAFAGGRLIPSMVQMVYTAGLKDVQTNYPELLDVIKKMAVLKIVQDAYLPQSGSISADGLSESMSVDIGKYHDDIDRTINGAPGTNGGLMSAIHGIRMIVT